MAYTTLISAADLAEHISSPYFVLLDCRHDLTNHALGREAYESGHLPGAQFVSMEHDAADHEHGSGSVFRGRHPLPSREAFIETLRGWGVNDNTQVVVYDAHGGMYAARLWWMLRWVGHAQVALLDGGLPAWQAQSGTLTQALPERQRGSISLKDSLVKTIDAAGVLANIATAERTVIDARAADRFRGENETIDPVGGHIPGAKNRFFKDNLSADGRFKSAEELRTVFAALVDDPAKAILQCGSGVTACHNALAMEIAGLSGATVYPGSWSEWCADPARPIERG